MTTTDLELRTMLRTIAERWPVVTAPDLLAALPASVAAAFPWSVGELSTVLRHGEPETLLAWVRRQGKAAPRDGLSQERFSAALAGTVAAIARLAVQAPVSDDEYIMLTRAAAEIQSAGLAGYLEAAAATPSASSDPRGGDLAGRLAKLEALHRINRAANASLHLTAMLDQVVEAVADVIGSDTCSVWTYHDETDELVLRAARGLNPAAIGAARLRLGQAITGEVARTRKPIAARDAPTHPAYEKIPLLNEERYLSQVSVPIIRFSADRLVGVLTLKTIRPRDFSQDDIRFLTTVAGELAISIENARLYYQTDALLREKVHELTTLQRVSALMAQTLDLGEVLKIIAQNAAELGRAERVSIIRAVRNTDTLELMASHGEEAPLSEARARVERDLIREVVKKAAPLRAAEPGGLVGLTSAQRPAAGEERFSIFGMPLRTVRGVLGGICLHYVGDRGPGDEQYGLLVSFATAAAIAIENAELYTGAQQNLRQMTDLLKELNHRVGNNLEILSGLLRMQMRRVSEPSALDALRGSYARIQSIATVHDLLTTTNLVSTTLDELVRVLLSAISVAVVPPGCQIRFHVEGRDIKVSSEQATILGLVVNEMVTNAVRHGLHDRQEGDVWINGRVEGGNVVITIEDNGRGVPPGFELEQQTGLGLQITSRMVSIDLKGQLTMANRPESGSLVTISFPYQPDGARPSRPPATVAS